MNLTQIIIVAVIVLLLAYDVFTFKIDEPTESQQLRDWARTWTILPFCAGFLSGHWFMPHMNLNGSAWIYALPVMGIVFGMDLIMRLLVNPDKSHGWWRWPGWYLLLGLPCGSILWGQTS